MNFSVNLLYDAERRRASRVTRRFGITAAVSIMGVLLLLAGIVFAVQAVTTKQRLGHAREQWTIYEPQFKTLKALQGDLQFKQGLLDELGGWTEARLRIRDLLDRLQSVLPPTMQLTRLSIGGSVEFEKIDTSKEDPAPPRVWHLYRININGQAEGEKSDETVVAFVNRLESMESFSDTFDSVKLQRLQRIGRRAASEEEEGHTPGRTFSIEITTQKLYLE